MRYKSRARIKIKSSDGRNRPLARDVLQKSTHCKSRTRIRFVHCSTPFTKRYAHREISVQNALGHDKTRPRIKKYNPQPYAIKSSCYPEATFVVNMCILWHTGSICLTFPKKNAKYRISIVNANVFLQVDAAYGCFASIAANVLRQVDAAYDFSASIAPCRGGMGEAQGDPPRQSAEASAGARLADRRVR